MVSMVGPLGHAGHGTPTGGGMEEGMGVVRQGHALSEDLGPSFGRGMGDTTERERNTSNLVGQDRQQQGGHAGHGQPASPEQGKGTQVQPGQQQTVGELTNPSDEAMKKRVPGYPQDMVMFMDKEVAKPETYGLPAGWTASFMGMMTMVRVLPPDMYEEVMRRVRAGIVEPPQGEPMRMQGGQQHKHE